MLLGRILRRWKWTELQLIVMDWSQTCVSLSHQKVTKMRGPLKRSAGVAHKTPEALSDCRLQMPTEAGTLGGTESKGSFKALEHSQGTSNPKYLFLHCPLPEQSNLRSFGLGGTWVA